MVGPTPVCEAEGRASRSRHDPCSTRHHSSFVATVICTAKWPWRSTGGITLVIRRLVVRSARLWRIMRPRRGTPAFGDWYKPLGRRSLPRNDSRCTGGSLLRRGPATNSVLPHAESRRTPCEVMAITATIVTPVLNASRGGLFAPGRGGVLRHPASGGAPGRSGLRPDEHAKTPGCLLQLELVLLARRRPPRKAGTVLQVERCVSALKPRSDDRRSFRSFGNHHEEHRHLRRSVGKLYQVASGSSPPVAVGRAAPELCGPNHVPTKAFWSLRRGKRARPCTRFFDVATGAGHHVTVLPATGTSSSRLTAIKVPSQSIVLSRYCRPSVIYQPPVCFITIRDRSVRTARIRAGWTVSGSNKVTHMSAGRGSRAHSSGPVRPSRITVILLMFNSSDQKKEQRPPCGEDRDDGVKQW